MLLGATGLLGRNVLNLLLERGMEVSALVRSNSFDMAAPSLDVCHGSLLNIEDLRNAAEGCDAIINCAGTTDMSLLHYDDYLPVNKQLCENLLMLMDELHISTYVHISTANTIGYGSASRPGNEDDPMRPPFTRSFYAQSKLEAEKLLAWESIQHPERHIIVLNPGFMVGAYDSKPSSGKLLLAGYKRRIMASPSGGKSFVHVADVATAAVNALSMGRNGERYLLTNADMSLKDFYAMQARICGYSQRFVTLPALLVALAGRVGDLLRRIGIRTQLSTRNVRQLQVMEYYCSDKARRELGFPSTPIEDAVRDFFLWYNGTH